VGEGPQKEYFLEVVKDYPQKIKSRIFMPGFVDNVRLKRLYEKAYVFAMPSIGEGFGLVYLEAMRYSIPCIAVNSHAAPELVNDGMTGLLIDDPNSHQEVLEALMWIMENPAECKKMGKAGYQLYCENYLYSKFRERFLKIIAQ
jgi:phosphatidylinositol alpha-1,6-mannosyltransferase